MRTSWGCRDQVERHTSCNRSKIPAVLCASVRFGWKAQVATVLSFSGDAALNEMGITNALVPDENAPNGDPVLLADCDDVSDPEDDFGFVDKITDFQRFLAPPPQTPRSGMSGEVIFNTTGCGNCHHSQPLTTTTVAEVALSNQIIKPYSDFLLHDMGSLGDGIVQGKAMETEMRTAPLWGIRVRDPLLHNGQALGGTFAGRVAAAVDEHGGDGAGAAANFQALSVEDQASLIAFLDSLGRREFDHDGNGIVDAIDFLGFRSCFEQGGPFSPDAPCAVSDIDQDGDVDLDDFSFFLQMYDGDLNDCDGNGEVDLRDIIEGFAEDCNGNTQPDGCDIAEGSSRDEDQDGIPDECEPLLPHLIWCAELLTGGVNSCAALEIALLSLGQNPVTIDDLVGSVALIDLLDDHSVLWVMAGTFPDNHPITAAEGSILSSLAAAGVAIFIEGSDIWGFDPPTSFTAYDGVEDTTVDDGDDSLTAFDGSAYGDLNLSDLNGISYTQDQAANEWTDQIIPTGSTPAEPVDIGGPGAGSIWTNNPDVGELPYAVGVYYEPEPPYGRVVAQSWEFGGFQGDTGVLADLYSSALVPSSSTIVFSRGDINGDGSFDIGDPIFLLDYLFNDATRPPCDDAGDMNDDGGLDIGDAVFGLAALFSGGPPPSDPHPGCGEDPSADPLLCVEGTPCF